MLASSNNTRLPYRKERLLTDIIFLFFWSAKIGFFGCWLLVVGCWLFVIGCWMLVHFLRQAQDDRLLVEIPRMAKMTAAILTANNGVKLR